jgi:hypothetical protein
MHSAVLVDTKLVKDSPKHDHSKVEENYIEYGNGQQDSSDTSSLADRIDSIYNDSEASIFRYGNVPPSFIHEGTDFSDHHSDGIPDNFEDLLNAEVLLPLIHNLPDASSKNNKEYTLWDYCITIQAENPLHEPVDDQEVQSTPLRLEQKHVYSSSEYNQ